MLLVIDNYDSFTYNLVQYLGELGAEQKVYRNDKITIEEVEDLSPDKILISPGPCTPEKAGISKDVISHFAGRTPILGVCLGHQSITEVFGGKVVRGEYPIHGKTSLVYHDNKGIFKDIPDPFLATRYHSLISERHSMPAVLDISAETKDGIVMGIRHREFDIEGVQFHQV